MKKTMVILLLFALGIVLPLRTAGAMPNVDLDYTNTSITIHENVNFTAQVSFAANITWLCNDVKVKSEFSTLSIYTFIPRAVGVYYIKLSVNGVTNPPPIVSTKVTVTEDQSTSPTPTHYPVPTPHTTYHKGDSYTTVYLPTEITPTKDAEPPKITIMSPINQTLISTNNFTVTFRLILEGSHPMTLQRLTYKTSWQSSNALIDFDSQKKYVNETIDFSIPLFNVPEGEQSIAINADTMSEFETGRDSRTEPVSGVAGIPPYGNYFYIYSNYYLISGSSLVDFTVDTSPMLTSSPISGDVTPNLELDSIGVVAVILGLVIAVSLLLYRRHQKNFMPKSMR